MDSFTCKVLVPYVQEGECRRMGNGRWWLWTGGKGLQQPYLSLREWRQEGCFWCGENGGQGKEGLYPPTFGLIREGEGLVPENF